MAIDTATPSNTAFTLPTFTNSMDGCGYKVSTLVLTGGDSASMAAIDSSSVPWKVSPSILTDEAYEFKLYMED